MITFASLGMSCQSAHQLARFAKIRSKEIAFAKGPFDWLICPPDSAANWLDHELCDFTLDEISEHRFHAYWPRFDFWFWHSFYSKTGDDKKLLLAANGERELSKLDYQRDAFRRLLPEETLFFISNTQNNIETDVFNPGEETRFRFTVRNVDRLQSSLNRFFGQPVSLQVITRPDRASPELLERRDVHLLPLENSEWKGSNSDWQNLLERIWKAY